MSKRGIGITLAFVAIAVAAIFSAGSGGGDEPYQVRAIFRNASFAIPGEDVKIAGAKVGDIDSLEVTKDAKAAVILNITDPGFQDFRSDAECIVRLQSLIGEKLIECQPTQPRPEGSPKAPPLKKIPDGQPGAGQYLLDEDHTITPVDVDLINNIQRLPFRQRLTILLNEFGVGLAGRGEDLRKVLREADPALRQLDRVVAILASQNKQLRDLAVDGDKVLAAWVKNRKQTADFIVQANTTGQAVAGRGDDLEQIFEKLPAFLRELKPTLEQIGALSDVATPVIADLGANAPDISRFLIELGPFARNAVPAFRTLGQTAEIAGPALKVARPVIQLVAKLAAQARPLSANLKSLLVHLKEADAIERVMDVIYFAALATNGFDQFGHYIRTSPSTQCTAINGTSTQCNAKFKRQSASSAASGATGGVTPLANALATPQQDRGGANAQAPAPQAQAGQRQASGATDQATTGTSKAGSKRSKEALLDYLLGSDGE